jgi:hypothetical protein
MKKYILFLLFICSLTFAKAQLPDTATLKQRLVLTEQQNKNWLDSLKKLNPEEQFSFIIERKVLDTNVVTMKLYPHGRPKITVQPGKFQGGYQPLVIIRTTFNKKQLMIDRLDNQSSTKLNGLKNKIIPAAIEILTDAIATAIYGIKGAGGVIILTISDKEQWKLLTNK